MKSLKLAATISNLGICALRRGNNKEAMAYLLRSLKIRQTSGTMNDHDAFVTLSNLGRTYDAMKNYDEAIPQYQRALLILEDNSHLHQFVSFTHKELGQAFARRSSCCCGARFE